VLLVIVVVVLFLVRRSNRTQPADTAASAEIDPVRVNMKEVILQSFSGTVYAGELKV
jgi:hypothetical protein